MAHDRARPSPLSGFWSLLVGGLFLVTLLVALQPITRQEDCPNYRGNGNASAFENPNWDVYLLLMAVVWIAFVAAEQALPITGRHRGFVVWAARAIAALFLAVVASCALVVPLGIMCH